MKTIAFTTAAVAFAAAVAAPASAGTIVTSFASNGSNYLPVAGATTNFTFDTTDTTSEAYGKGYVATIVGSASATMVAPSGTTGTGASVIAPAPNDGNGYYAIGGMTQTGVQSSLTLLGKTALSSISVFIGTLDYYNQVQLLDKAGAVIGSFDGVAMNNNEQPYRGQVVPANNRRVTFTGTDGQVYYGVRFANIGNHEAFEFDNLSLTAAVPEPATWAMMLVGFGMVGGASRYRRRNTQLRYA